MAGVCFGVAATNSLSKQSAHFSLSHLDSNVKLWIVAGDFLPYKQKKNSLVFYSEKKENQYR